MGEGWHNNHHYFMSSVRQGIRWWEIDVTYYVLRVLSWVGHRPRPAAVPRDRVGGRTRGVSRVAVVGAGISGLAAA